MNGHRPTSSEVSVVKRAVGIMTVLAWCGILAIACIDTSPVVIYKDGGVPGAVDDASSDAPDPYPACSACIARPSDPGPGCGNELALCADTPYCMFIYDCAYAAGCVFKRTHNESVSCALPCALQLKNAFDAAITAAIALTMCFHSSCADVCEVEP